MRRLFSRTQQLTVGPKHPFSTICGIKSWRQALLDELSKPGNENITAADAKQNIQGRCERQIDNEHGFPNLQLSQSTQVAKKIIGILEDARSKNIDENTVVNAFLAQLVIREGNISEAAMTQYRTDIDTALLDNGSTYLIKSNILEETARELRQLNQDANAFDQRRIALETDIANTIHDTQMDAAKQAELRARITKLQTLIDQKKAEIKKIVEKHTTDIPNASEAFEWQTECDRLAGKFHAAHQQLQNTRGSIAAIQKELPSLSGNKRSSKEEELKNLQLLAGTFQHEIHVANEGLQGHQQTYKDEYKDPKVQDAVGTAHAQTQGLNVEIAQLEEISKSTALLTNAHDPRTEGSLANLQARLAANQNPIYKSDIGQQFLQRKAEAELLGAKLDKREQTNLVKQISTIQSSVSALNTLLDGRDSTLPKAANPTFLPEMRAEDFQLATKVRSKKGDSNLPSTIEILEKFQGTVEKTNNTLKQLYDLRDTVSENPQELHAHQQEYHKLLTELTHLTNSITDYVGHPPKAFPKELGAGFLASALVNLSVGRLAYKAARGKSPTEDMNLAQVALKNEEQKKKYFQEQGIISQQLLARNIEIQRLLQTTAALQKGLKTITKEDPNLQIPAVEDVRTDTEYEAPNLSTQQGEECWYMVRNNDHAMEMAKVDKKYSNVRLNRDQEHECLTAYNQYLKDRGHPARGELQFWENMTQRDKKKFRIPEGKQGHTARFESTLYVIGEKGKAESDPTRLKGYVEFKEQWAKEYVPAYMDQNKLDRHEQKLETNVQQAKL